MTHGQIRKALLDLIAQLARDEAHAKDMIRHPETSGLQIPWWEGVRDATQAHANHLRKILDAIDATKGQ